jgi:hypothetical protein
MVSFLKLKLTANLSQLAILAASTLLVSCASVPSLIPAIPAAADDNASGSGSGTGGSNPASGPGSGIIQDPAAGSGNSSGTIGTGGGTGSGAGGSSGGSSAGNPSPTPTTVGSIDPTPIYPNPTAKPTATPIAISSPTPTAMPSATPTPKPSASPTPSAVPTPVGTPKPTPVPSPTPVTKASPTPAPICNPLGTGTTGSANNGLVADLSFLNPTQVPSIQNVMMFWNQNPDGSLTAKNGVNSQIFVNDLDVPERYFDQGFSTIDQPTQKICLPGQPDVPLLEWFSLHFQSHLKLGNAAPGKYYLAMITDDGAVLKINDNTAKGLRVYVNNDGTHAEQMGCPKVGDYVTLDASSDIPIDVNYYQGPRWYIAMMLIWKKVPDSELGSNSVSDKCGKSGENTFFNGMTNPPTELQNYTDLKNEGWSPVPASSYFLPGNQTNPCVK